MEELEKKVLNHLSGSVNKYYQNLLLVAQTIEERRIVRITLREYRNRYGGAFDTIIAAKSKLIRLGLIVPIGDTDILLPPIATSEIGKICANIPDFQQQKVAIKQLLEQRSRNWSTAELVADAYLVMKHNNEINNLQKTRSEGRSRNWSNAPETGALDFNTNTLESKSLSNINNNDECSRNWSIAPETGAKDKKMSYKEQVTQIWESWNEFAMKYAGATRRTKLPKPREVDSERNTTATSLYDSMTQWIIDQGDDWWENWLDFIELAKNNTWLSSKEGFTVTLVNVFRGTINDPTPVIIKAMEGLYDGWNLKVTNNLNEAGKPTEAKLAEYNKGAQGMKKFGEMKV